MNNAVYLGLGSNIGDSCAIIQQALNAIAQIPHVEKLRVSSLYQTSPVSPLAQRDFINCACALNTTLSPKELYEALHRIEISLGKTPKEKNAPRAIDIDILLFGRVFYRTQELCIPHLHWRERLFVLAPLSELTQEIIVPVNDRGDYEIIDLQDFLQLFSNPHQESVMRLANDRKIPRTNL
jgi:2-amino-4-hydroxy-6-hydroxymethyldihydropteridine diphosphokinase